MRRIVFSHAQSYNKINRRDIIHPVKDHAPVIDSLLPRQVGTPEPRNNTVVLT
jgi:hypothetical protein